MVKASIHRNSIISLYRGGLSAPAIQRRLGLGTVSDRTGRGRRKSVITGANIKKLRGRLRKNPNRSVRKLAKDMNISGTSLRSIVKNTLKMTAYKKNRSQLITDATKQKRKTRCRQLLRRFGSGKHVDILFTDEKIFTVEATLNKQNDRVYATTQPSATVTRRSHPQSVMVWAGITATGKTPLIFVPQGVKVNVANYLDLLRTQALPWAKKHFKQRK